MARTTYDTCSSIMINMQGRGLETEATRRDVMEAIIQVAGETRATRDRYMNALKKHGFIKQIGGGMFTLNFNKVDNDTEMGLIGELTQRVTRAEIAIAKLRKNQGAEHDG